MNERTALSERRERSGLQVATELDTLVAERIAPGTGVDVAEFWEGFAALLTELQPRNAALLARRDELQAQIDDWHLARKGQTLDAAEYKAFLEEIGYLVTPPEAFTISTTNVDEEIAQLAGPQLVVPVTNARFALNAANARWGSLYDALYGTDAISEAGGAERAGGYNPVRGERVIAFARDFLDAASPLASGSHAELVKQGGLYARLAALQFTEPES